MTSRVHMLFKKIEAKKANNGFMYEDKSVKRRFLQAYQNKIFIKIIITLSSVIASHTINRKKQSIT